MARTFRLNGKTVTYVGNTEDCVLTVLRKRFSCLETSWGCDVGQCASCAIVVDGQVVRSCKSTMSQLDDCEVVTAAALSEAWFEWMTTLIRRDHYCALCLPSRLLMRLTLRGKMDWVQAQSLTPDMMREARLWLGIPHCQCGEYRHIVRQDRGASAKS